MEFQQEADKTSNAQFVWKISVFKGGVPSPDAIAPEQLQKGCGPLLFTEIIPGVGDLKQLENLVADVCAQKLGRARSRMIPQTLYSDGNGDNNVSRAWIYVAAQGGLYTVFAMKTQNLDAWTNG